MTSSLPTNVALLAVFPVGAVSDVTRLLGWHPATMAALICISFAATSGLPLAAKRHVMQQHDDVMLALAVSSRIGSNGVSVTSQIVRIRAKKYDVNPQRSQVRPRLPNTSSMTSSAARSRDSLHTSVNLMILPLGAILVFLVLLFIRASRWCVADIREADEATTTASNTMTSRGPAAGTDWQHRPHSTRRAAADNDYVTPPSCRSARMTSARKVVPTSRGGSCHSTSGSVGREMTLPRRTRRSRTGPDIHTRRPGGPG